MEKKYFCHSTRVHPVQSSDEFRYDTHIYDINKKIIK